MYQGHAHDDMQCCQHFTFWNVCILWINSWVEGTFPSRCSVSAINQTILDSQDFFGIMTRGCWYETSDFSFYINWQDIKHSFSNSLFKILLASISSMTVSMCWQAFQVWCWHYHQWLERQSLKTTATHDSQTSQQWTKVASWETSPLLTHLTKTKIINQFLLPQAAFISIMHVSMAL